MAPKRPPPAPSVFKSTQHSQPAKRARLLAGRQIPAGQSTRKPSIAPALGKANEAALKNVPELPANVAVERFASARASEITSMKKAMKNAFLSATKRAFQTLPRHLRRRAASHNARRVPGRLRAKAASEIDPKTRTNPKHYPRKKISKKTGLSKTERFRRRQRSKTWLETHIWHAKRMHMVNVWGFRLAHHPTEKSFRPSHRAATHGSILNDVSYFSLLELKAQENILERILKLVAGEVCWGKRFNSGSRQAQTTLYIPCSYPRDLLCPATVLWQSLPISIGTEPEAGPSRQPLSTDPERKIWIRFHACSHAEVWGALRKAITQVLEDIKREARDEKSAGKEKKNGKGKSREKPEIDGEGEDEVRVELNDIRDTVNVFEIVGPKAGRVLKGALGALVKGEERSEMKEIWRKLPDLTTLGSIPTGMVMGFKVYDPRLIFPPKNVKLSDPSVSNPRAPAFGFQPSAELARSDLWDDAVRQKVGKKKTRKVELDVRRARLGIPGQPLRAIAQDARIPLLLIQHSISIPSASHSVLPKTSMHGYTLYLPKAWAQPFLHSLVFTGTRIGGIRERQSQAYETGSGGFPADWPGTNATERWWAEKEREDKGRWEKRPSSKRVNWDSMGWKEGGNPWKPDWEGLLSSTKLGGISSSLEGIQNGEKALNKDAPWLLRLPSSAQILQTISTSQSTPGLALLSEINAHRVKRSLPPLEEAQAASLYATALVRVSVEMLGRGVAEEVGPIYTLGEDEVGRNEEARWREAFAGGKKGRDLDWDEESQIPMPAFSDVIGYQTAGAFSLSRGKGHGLGAIPLSSALALLKRDMDHGRVCLTNGRFVQKRGELLNLVKVRARDSNVVRAAVLEMID